MKKTTVKRAFCGLLAALFALLLPGCWNYVGINEITIISGIGIDRDEATQTYRLTYEIVDLTKSIKETGIQSKLVEATGKTLFDAARNAKKRLVNKLYFGNTQVVIVSEKIAREGILSVIDWFMRDGETRETIAVAISREKDAKEIFTAKGIDESLLSYEMKKIIERDQKVTGSTRNCELYCVFNTLKGEGTALTAPAFHTVMNDQDQTTEIAGVAVFKEDKLVGYLDALETNRLLFVLNKIRAGVLTLSYQSDGPENVSLEIAQSETDVSYAYENGKAKVSLAIRTWVYVDEFASDADLSDKKVLEDISAIAAKQLSGEITALIKRVQSEYGADIFGFGTKIYKKDPKLWEEIKPRWEELFRAMDVTVECKIVIANTGALRKN